MRKVYGYDYNEKKDKYTINKEESEVIKKIFRLYVQGFSLQTISNQLNKEEVPCYNGKWHKEYISDIIRDETYTGTRLVIQKVHNNHPAIISDNMFYKIQEMAERKAGYVVNLTSHRKITHLKKMEEM